MLFIVYKNSIEKNIRFVSRRLNYYYKALMNTENK